METIMEVKEQLRAILECCICKEMYTRPKMLRCIHTFCLKCLQEVGSTAMKSPGDKMSCPVCRKEFSIPLEGFVALQPNFFIERLIEVAKKFVSTLVPCDACTEDFSTNSTPTEISPAKMFCADCDQSLCQECVKQHSRNKASKDHVIVPIGSREFNRSGLLLKATPSECPMHEKEQHRFYCLTCKTVLCALCFLKDHQGHDWRKIDELDSQFREDIKEHSRNMSICEDEIAKKSESLEQTKLEFLQELDNLETAINTTRNDLKELVDRQANSLLTELGSLRQQRLKEIETERENFERHCTILESYKMYCSEISDKGAAIDICRAVCDINLRANELKELHQSVVSRQLRSYEISFKKGQLEDGVKLVGEIQTKFSYRIDPVLVQTIQTSDLSSEKPKSVRALTVLNNELFVVYDQCPAIDVYDSSTLNFKRQIELEWSPYLWSLFGIQKLEDPLDITSCSKNKCLYIMDWKEDCEFAEILRVDPGGKVLRNWSTRYDVGLLSVTHESNVLVTISDKNKISEYTPDGKLFSEIQFWPEKDIAHPRHSIRMTNGHLVVSFGNIGDNRSGVCVVDGKGTIVESFDFKSDSGDIRLNRPMYLALDCDGAILVADAGNSRILLLSRTLEFQRELISRKDGLRYPSRMHLDSDGQLYLVDTDNEASRLNALILVYNTK